MNCYNVIIILNVFYTTFSHHAYWLNSATLFELIYKHDKPMSGCAFIFDVYLFIITQRGVVTQISIINQYYYSTSKKSPLLASQ